MVGFQHSASLCEYRCQESQTDCCPITRHPSAFGLLAERYLWSFATDEHLFYLRLTRAIALP